MLAALSTAHKLGLGLSGLAFVIFALVTSMLLPRRNPDFPGRHKTLYIVVCFLFFVGMMTAVLVFGKEAPKPEHSEAAPTAALYR
jgi:hypothetical protein